MHAIKIHRVIKTILFLFLGLTYYFITQLFNFYIPCVFNSITGLLCPGCGITTACIAVIEFRFIDAIYANLGMMIISPILLFLIAKLWILWILDKRDKNSKVTESLAFLCVIILIVWSVIRNIF